MQVAMDMALIAFDTACLIVLFFFTILLLGASLEDGPRGRFQRYGSLFVGILGLMGSVGLAYLIFTSMENAYQVASAAIAGIVSTILVFRYG